METSITDIAIIGMAGRFPGAGNVGEFWRNLCAGVESIRRFSTTELDGIAQKFATAPNYVKARAIVDDADKFDAAFFGIFPKEAELIDPQQRIFLECCWHAFEDAGYDPAQCAGAVGVYAGCSPNSYFLRNICADGSFSGEYTAGYQVSNVPTMLGSNFEFLPTRVAYKLNLRGPAFSLNCGCSTSLVAVCQACLSLQNYQCDMALAGGVSITLPQARGYLHEPGGMVSPDGHCRTFDEAAQGTVFGDGAGVVLLKRLEDALADGDHVYAIIKGFGLTNDGSAKVGFSAPGVEGQERAIAMAHAAAGVDPASITYIEAHGTGTPLGDPIEIAALTQAFRRQTQAKGFCAIGAVKTNIGHLDVAAGVAGLIKTVLCLHHKMLPPTLNFVTPNPALQLEDSPFYVNTELTPWRGNAVPLRAGVSAFGMGGTNAHAVLEEAPQVAPSQGGKRPRLLVLSARTELAIENVSANLAIEIANVAQDDLGDIAWTLMNGRRAFEVRRSVVANDCADAVAALSLRDAKRVVTRSTRPERPAVAFMFPGQGTQYVAMGRGLATVNSYFREQLDRGLKIFESFSDIALRTLLLTHGDGSDKDQIVDTLLAQPALFILEYALARFWIHLGVVPSAMVGHSVGEFAAACVAGVFSLEDGIRLVTERGRMMHEMPSGAMLAVRLSESQLAPFLRPGLDLAAINGPALAVVAGPDDAVCELEQRLDASGIAHRRLRTSHAFHSAMMDPVTGPFRELVERVVLKPPSIPFISTLSGDWISAGEAMNPDYWARHLRSPVRFSDGVSRLRATDWALLEVGPGNTLSTLARQHTAQYREQLLVSSLPDKSLNQSDDETVLNALGQLWGYGVNPVWLRLYADEKRRRVPLPVYPFERKRFWFETSAAHTQRPLTAEPNESNRSINEAEMNGVDSPTGAEHWAGANQVTTVNMEKAQDDRKTRIRTTLEAIFADLSGLDMSSMPTSATFLEMGFDSLFLTQVSQALQSKFGLKIRFRQLVDQLSDLGALTDYVESNLPSDAVQPPPLAPAPRNSSPGPMQTALPPADLARVAPPAEGQAPLSAANGAGAIAGDIEDLCKLQLQTLSEVMAKQLEMMRDAGRGVSHTASAGTAETATVQPVLALQSSAREAAETIPGEAALAASPRFRPLIQTGNSGEVTDAQRRHLDTLIDRYNRRTAGSKQMTQNNRARLADPRVAAGLRPQWKELVYPIVTVRSKGSKLWDIDGNEYIDLVNGYGPIMLGHAPDFVTAAVLEQLQIGYETGPQSPIAGQVAAALCEMTGMERAAFCNTGSEAVMAAFRLARTVTGRNKIVLFSGAYHGMFDEVLVKGLKGTNGPRSMPAAPGIPREKVENVTVLDYGTSQSIRYIEAHAAEIAAVIVEPVQSRHPGLQPVEFLRQLRALTERSGTAFIFDEVVTGFRVHPGGAQALFSIKADLATYGKVLGGGLPIGVVAGKAVFMDALDGGMWNYGDDSYPETGVTFFAGTFVRHPLALAAARAVLAHLKNAGPQLQERLNTQTSAMVAMLNGVLNELQIPVTIETFCSISYFSFPSEYKFASLFYYLMREKGVYIQEGFPLFLTTAHSEEDIAHTVRAFRESLVEMQASGFLPTPTPSVHISNGADSYAHANGFDHQPLPELAQNKANPAIDLEASESAPLRAPLTESQMEIWLSASLSDEASCAYNESFTLKLRGNLNRSALLGAIDRLIQRHEALRATFSPEGDFQEFVPELKIQVPNVDLSGLEEAERTNRLTEILADDARLPFNLIAGPLVRVKLIRMTPEEHHLLFTSHHIVCDGWSTNVILDELSNLYSSLSAGTVCELPAPLGFGAFARTQAEHFTGEEGASNESYWVEQFKQPAALLDLPLDRPRPPVKSYDGATFRRVIEAQTYLAIKQFAAKQKCTLFVALLAAFQALLSRISGQDDIVVGIPTAGQSLLGDDVLVGHCVNFLPLRAQVAADLTMAQFLAQTKRNMLDASDHQNYTYGRLVRKLSIQRDPSRLPLMEVQFNLERVGTTMEFSGLEVEVSPNAKAYVNSDLFFNVIESDHGLILDCDYNTRLFDQTTIGRWLDHYATLLKGAVADVNQLLSLLPLISEKEWQQLVVEFNDTAAAFPDDQCVHQLFEEQARRTPRAVAAVYENRQLTYAELSARADVLARYLATLGVKPGVMVGVFVERSLDMIVALLGVLKAGAAFVPMDPTYPVERISFVLQDAEVPVLLTQSCLAANLPKMAAQLIRLDADWDLIEQGAAAGAQPAVVNSRDLAYIIYTSGSTGQPKGVEIQHCSVVNLLCSMRKKPGLAREDTLLAVTTLSFDMAMLELFLPLVVGAKLVIAGRETAADGNLLLARLISSGATVVQATPITFRMLLEAGWADQPRVKVICGGEPLTRDLANQLLGRTTSLWNYYGPTETTVYSSGTKVPPEGLVSIGTPVDNTQLHVLDSNRQLCPIGKPGELHIGGVGLARGYFRRPELTAEKFIQDPFRNGPAARLYRTGDLVRRLADGSIDFLGRLDYQIKLRGYRIELGEIEAALRRHPAVRDAVVTLREDVPGDKRLIAYLASDQHALTIRGVREFLTGKLPNYMLPSAVVRMDAMPLTPNGKVDRRALPVPESNGVRDKEYVAPRTVQEKIMVEIWAEVLHIERVGIHDNLFELGADSLHIFKIAARVNKAGIKLSPAQFLKYRTVATLLQQLEIKAPSEEASSMPSIVAISRENFRVKRPSL